MCAALAQRVLLAEDLADGFDGVIRLVLRDEGVEADGNVRLGGEAATDADAVADLFDAFVDALQCGECDVVDLRVAAPYGAAGDTDLELARKVVELGVRGKLLGDLDGERRGVEDLVARFTGSQEAGEWAAGDVANDVAAGALRREADGGERVHDLGQALDGEPVQLDVLARGDVGDAAGVLRGDVGDDVQLVRGEQAVGQADAHHEVVTGQAFAVLAAGDAEAVTLGVNAPPLEVQASPLRQHAGASFAGKLANLVPSVPGVLG